MNQPGTKKFVVVVCSSTPVVDGFTGKPMGNMEGFHFYEGEGAIPARCPKCGARLGSLSRPVLGSSRFRVVA